MNRQHLGLVVATVAIVSGVSWPLPGVADTIEQQLEISPFGDATNRDRDVADRLMRLGNQQRAEGSYQQAINTWYEAIDAYDRLGDLSAIGIAYDFIGLTYADLGRYSEAEDLLRRRLAVAVDNDDLHGQVFGWNNLGSLFLQRGNLIAAEDSFNQGLDVAQSIEDYRGIGLSLSNMAVIERSRGNYRDAIKLFERASAFRYAGGDLLGEANTLNNLGDLYTQINQPERALGAYGLALRAAEASGDRRLQLHSLNGLYRSYQALGEDYSYSIEQVLDQRVALTLNESTDPFQQMITYRQLGEFFESDGEVATAESFYQRALAIAREIEDKQQEVFLTNRLLVLQRLSE
ncbi:MAG: tetratricopeptide repeat protein [Cyanobacteria bacterium J06639_16]